MGIAFLSPAACAQLAMIAAMADIPVVALARTTAEIAAAKALFFPMRDRWG